MSQPINNLVKLITSISLIVSLAVITGCATYKMDIRQGNFLETEVVDKLSKGMTKAKVVQTLGSPLLKDIFHQDRWDYYYSLKSKNGRKFEDKKVTLFFKDNKLSQIARDRV